MASDYNETKNKLQSLEKKSTGSLIGRYLGDLVKKEHFVIGSEFLTTVLVVIPKHLYKDWESKYETLVEDSIVPRSSRKIYEDNEHGLFNVTLFTKELANFKQKARDQRFIVRDFVYSEEALAEGNKALAKLEHDKRTQYSKLVIWLKVNFSEAFSAWIHVKALRVFVESVLRYGLPVNFQAIVMHPHKKSIRKLRDILNEHYSHLDTSIAQGPIDDIPGINLGQQEYYPYVYFKISLETIESLSKVSRT